MKKTLFALLALGMAGTASADAINSFTWDTWSSDDKMYVCNVGIRHERGTEGHVDENSGGANSGNTTSTHDYLTVTYSTLDVDQNRGPEVTKVIEAHNSTTTYNQLVRDVDAHKMVITSLQVNLTSENYGAKYFVDVCYRGNQIDFAGNNIKTNFRLKHNQLTYSDHANAGSLNYFSEAKLAVASKTVCDLQSTGRNTSHDNGLNYNQNDSNIANGSGDRVVAAGERGLTSGSQVVQFVSPYRPVGLNRTSTDAPRYCKTRYEVAEKRVKVAAVPATPRACVWRAYNYRTRSYVLFTLPNSVYFQGSRCYRASSYRYSYCRATPSARATDFCRGIMRLYRYYRYTNGNPGSAAVLQERNWTRMGGRFTALTEIENNGLQ